jgi:hypothetical protein
MSTTSGKPAGPGAVPAKIVQIALLVLLVWTIGAAAISIGRVALLGGPSTYEGSGQ